MANTEKEMSFLEHLEVLRWHLVRSAIAIITFAILAFIFKNIIFDYILLGPKNADFWTYRMFCKLSHFLNFGDALCIGKDLQFELINTDMSGQFSTHISTSIIAGLVIAFPYILFEMWSFIKPALNNKETNYARGTVFWGSLLFAVGVLFGYYLIAPLSVQFLGNYQVSELVSNKINLSSYISTVTLVTLSCAIVFELPLLVYFLSKLGILTPQFMRKFRKHAIVVVLIISAIITPPDVTSQILVSLPLFVLYEISIFISDSVNKKTNK
jgi:sec-independent protein translocase protein TatC